MFAHAMINTNDTITVSSATNATIGPAFPGTGEEASSRNPIPRFCSWYSCSIVWPMTSISAAAWAIETGAFSRPPIRNARAARSVNVPRDVTVSTMPTGTQTSNARTPVPWNPSAATPTTVKGCPFSLKVRPTMVGSLSKRRVHKP